MSKLSILSPEESFRSSVFLRNRRRLKPAASSELFWLAPKFQRWKDENGSSLLMINGTFRDRFAVKDFCVDAIEIIRDSGVPVLWALKTVVPGGGIASDVSAVEFLKSLVSQALCVLMALQTESFMAAISARMGRAVIEEDWLDILGFALSSIREVVIIVDVELLNPALNTSPEDYSMPLAFLTLFKKLTKHNAKTTVKVIMVSYGSSAFSMPAQRSVQDLVLAVGRAGKRTPPAARKIRGISRKADKTFRMSLRQAMTKRME